MSSNFKFELNYDGVGELLRSSEMVEVIEEYTANVLSVAGEGYESDTQVYNRAVGMVYADTKEAYKDNLENNTLLNALGS